MTSTIKRILFTITTFRAFGTGAGGHYYSLRELAQELGCDHDVLVIGDFFPPALKGFPNVHFAEVTLKPVPRLDPAWIAGLQRADIVHAFDHLAALHSAEISRRWRVPLVFTKPGGPALSKATPVFENMIVFHEKDRQSMASRPFPPRNIALIANRVRLEPVAPEEDRDPFDGMPEARFRILTIGRLGTVYREKTEQAIALREAVEARLGPANLCVVGKVQEADAFEALRSRAGPTDRVRFLTDEESTFRAVRYLPHCDIAVGSGRGFMEALGHNLYVFFAVRGTELPCFATAETYPAAFAENFSPRVCEDDTVRPDAAFETFVQTVETGAEAWRAWAAETFSQDHDIATGARRTRAFYESLSGHEGLLSARGAPLRYRMNGVLKHALKKLR